MWWFCGIVTLVVLLWGWAMLRTAARADRIAERLRSLEK
jgi:hypothetical protein